MSKFQRKDKGKMPANKHSFSSRHSVHAVVLFHGKYYHEGSNNQCASAPSVRLPR
jgi:hypothetical protein